jgi:small conductance mechanosensitive channel
MPLDINHASNLLLDYGINFAGALVIAILFWWLAGLAERLTRRALASPYMDPTVAAFMTSLVRYAVLVIALVLILQVIGIQATSLVAVVGAASLAIGLALQGTLSNMAAGVMLLIFRPFHIGDSVEVAGKSGKVKNLNLFMTEIASGDNVQVLIPNGQVWGAALTNLSAYATRQVSVRFAVAPDRDLDALAAALRRYLEDDARVLRSPPPAVTVSDLTDKGLEVSLQAWTKSENAGEVRAGLLRRVLTTLRETVPSNQHETV